MFWASFDGNRSDSTKPIPSKRKAFWLDVQFDVHMMQIRGELILKSVIDNNLTIEP